MTVRSKLASGVAVVALAVFAWLMPGLRHELTFDLTYWDAPPGDAVELPAGTGPGLQRVPRTRVVLIDGLDAAVTPALANWSKACSQGLALTVDVGFPTVSLPVEVALWTGLTQQQTGIVHRGGGKNGKYGRPLDPPLDRRGIPAQIPGSIAIAEDHGWIARSLGFAITKPPAGDHPADDRDLETWATQWEREAQAAVASTATLAFVHVLRVDSAGHKYGVGPQYGRVAADADAILGRLLATPGADIRWFLLSDHGHLGGHGGEERSLRHVEACIVGAGVLPSKGPLVHVVDVARAIADSTGATLDPATHGRPLAAALAAPLGDDQAVPALDLARGVLAIFLVALALVAIGWARTWWLAPWWFAIACLTLLVVQGEPTLSVGWLYAWDGRAMLELWIPALVVGAFTTWLGLGKTTLARVLAAQFVAPLLVLGAAITASGAWSTVFGAEVAPAVPHYTAYMLVLVLLLGAAAAAIALAILARLVAAMLQRQS